MTTGRPKRAEILLAEQGFRGVIHELDIECVAVPRHQVVQQRWPDRRIADDVTISTRCGAEARVKFFTHFLRPMNSDIRRQVTICSHDPSLKASANGIIKMHHLSKTVNPGVSSTSACCPNRFPGDLLKGCLQSLLHRGNSEVGLGLPTMVVTAVVLNSRRDTRVDGQWRIRQSQ